MPTSPAARLVRSQRVIEGYRLAPDAESVVYVLRVVVGDRYRSHLWRVPWSGGRARQLTHGAVRDAGPAISPDGGSVAFVRSPTDRDDAIAQAWILPLAGGDALPLTALKHGVGSVHWSPDGRRLALVAEAGPDRFAVGERDGKAPRARRITRLDYRNDEAGALGRRSHLWVMPARPGARPRQLTQGDFDVTDVTWAPDGSHIAFSADPGPDANIAPRSRIFAVSSTGGPMRELAALPGDAARPAFSPDGRHLAFLGTDADDPADWVQPQLFLVDADGGTPRSLSADLDLPAGGWAWSDLALSEEVPGPIWLGDRSLGVLVGRRGRSLPYRITVEGEAEPLVDPAMRLAGVGLAHAAGRTALSAGHNGRAAEVYAIEAGRLRPVTSAGSSWQRRQPRFTIDELELPGPSGPIQAWLASPATVTRRRRLPLIVHLHGGPTSSWAPGGTADATLLTAAGYRVVMPNIRGSATFGAEFVRALAGHWGEVDAADALAVVDALVTRGLADPRRLGVLGLSYGGFLAQWLVGITDRFAAAVAENGVTNQVSAWGTSYFGVHFNRRAGLTDPLSDEGVNRLWASSPLRNAARITTPLLILQAEEDRICPPSDNEQLFAALKVLGRETELILYPEEHHEMKNSGRPDRRIDRHERILSWFARWFADGRSGR
jgi:dipeptidyl aminopeptidase/acylaminoacyl peptidase